MREDADQVASTFESACEISSPEARAAFLDQTCQGRPELRRQVESLLRANQSARQFLRTDTDLDGRECARPGTEASASERPGGRVGHYHLMGLIGEGASSTVYLAEQREPVRRWVALKIVKPGMDTQRVISRFELERQALALMDHPGIAKVLDAGATASGRPYFVMEWVRGTEITRHCDTHRLDVPQRLALFCQVCQAVLHAHQKGIIHRDIKPANILISVHDGRAFPKVIDFGIAKVMRTHLSQGTLATQGMPFLGTPAYMSPEQAEMGNPDLDTRTDIYSLGALLYELLTGHPPFDHNRLIDAGLDGLRDIIRFEEPLRPSARFRQLRLPEQRRVAANRRTTPEGLQRSLLGDLDWIALKALEKERDQRYGTAASLGEDIHRHLSHEPVSAAAPTLRYRVGKLVRRNRKTVVTAGGVVLMLVLSAVLSSWLAFRARANAEKAQHLQRSAEALEQRTHAAMIKLHVSTGLGASEDGDYGQAILWFANAARAAGTESRQFQVNARRVQAWMEHTPMPVGALQLSGVIQTLRFSPDSRYLLAVTDNRKAALWDTVKGVSLDWINSAAPLNAAAWGADGSLLALALERGEVQLRRPEDGSVWHTIPHAEPATAVAFTPDGHHLLFGGRTLRLWDLDRQTLATNTWPHPEPVTAISFAGNSDVAATACADGQARVFSLTKTAAGASWHYPPTPHQLAIRTDACDSKTKYREDFLDSPHAARLTLMADGQRIITRTEPYEATVREVQTGRVLRLFSEICCSCNLAVNPAQTLVAGGVHGGNLGVWELASGRPHDIVTIHQDCIFDVTFSPCGTLLLTGGADHSARLWSLNKAEPVHPHLSHSTDVDKVAFAPNGRLIATVQSDGLTRVWALPSAEGRERELACGYGPWQARLNDSGTCVIAVKEPAWEAEIRQTAVYSAETGEPLSPIIELDGLLEDAVLSPDERRLAVAAHGHRADATGTVRFYDVKTGQLSGEPIPLPSRPASLAWHPSRDEVAVICHTGELLRVPTGTTGSPPSIRQELALPRRLNPAVRFTSDGRHLICLVPEGEIEIRDADTGRLRHRPLRSAQSAFWHFAISPDNQWLATTSADGSAMVWEIATGLPAGRVLMHAAWVFRGRFSPDGTVLATASHDACCRLWNWRTGELVCQPFVHPNAVYDAAFTKDGQWVLTACRDGSLRLWDPQTGHGITPPYKVGEQAFNVEVAADGRHAFVGDLGPSLRMISLAPRTDIARWSADELCLLGEVVSGSELRDGRPQEFGSAGWLTRFHRLAKLHPEMFRPTDRSRKPPTPPPPFQAPAVKDVSAGMILPSLPPARTGSELVACPESGCASCAAAAPK